MPGNDELTEDIKPQWLNLIRRLQSVARKGSAGPALMDLSIIVDEEGSPIFWTQPDRPTLDHEKSQGPALLTLTIIIDSDGHAILWTGPKRLPLEPKRRAPEVIGQLTNS